MKSVRFGDKLLLIEKIFTESEYEYNERCEFIIKVYELGILKAINEINNG